MGILWTYPKYPYTFTEVFYAFRKFSLALLTLPETCQTFDERLTSNSKHTQSGKCARRAPGAKADTRSRYFVFWGLARG